jgi:hypothetical protein
MVMTARRVKRDSLHGTSRDRTAAPAVVSSGLELEFWAPVAEAPMYDVSTWGRVRQGDLLLESWPNKKGYRLVSLEIEGRSSLRYVHRLVLMAFVGPGVGALANHGDGRKGNNRLRNLCWTTPSGNMQHAWATGLIPRTRAPRTTCRYGHPRTPTSTVLVGRTPRLQCVRCKRAAARRRWAALAGLVALPQLLT